MKKILLTFMAAIGLAASANAQLAEGSLFPFPDPAAPLSVAAGLTPVNTPFNTLGSINLDSISNAGYTIFLDVSATWCHPCWLYHESKALDTLWEQHGPAGAPGVNASTTNDVFVIFVQGEGTSHLAEFFDGPGATVGSASVETPYATASQGNWVAGTPFPMVDDTTSTDPIYGTNALDALWSIAYFPTVYMICRDHIVHVLTQPTYTAAYAAAVAGCPSTPPASGSSVDAKASVYSGNSYYVCNANPSVTFQNYSTAASITSATVTVTDGTGATVATVPWSGSLAPYALQNVSVPSFAGTTFGGYKYSVNVTGDITASNNSSADSAFKIYAASNASAIPYTDNFLSGISYKYTFPSDYSIAITNPLWSGCPNPSGVTENQYVYFDFVDNSTYYGGGIFDWAVGNFNTTTAGTMTFSFDMAYAQATGSGITGADAMSLLTSTDCGSTWTTAWTASGAALATAASTAIEAFQPASASDWKLITVDLAATDDNSNLMFRFTGTPGTSLPSNVAFVTNLDLKAAALSVNQPVNVANFISVTPNPAKDIANVNVTLSEAANVQVQMYDAVGRVVNSSSENFPAGDQKISLSTTDLAAGLYYVKINVGGITTTKALSVIK